MQKQGRAVTFVFSSWKFEPQKKRILFHYATEFGGGEAPITFTETILLPRVPDIARIPKRLLRKLLNDTHIMLGISYYKFYCATKLEMPRLSTEEDAQLWNAIYKKGLGEFFYRNNLDPGKSPRFPFKKSLREKPMRIPKSGRLLVAIGGGKDSLVSAELQKEIRQPFHTFYIATNGASDITRRVAKAIGAPSLVLRRQLDSKVFAPHPYNGHIPISAIYAMLGTLAAALYGYDGLVVSNEQSSNFGNLTYKGLAINHQWSKSLEFEQMFSSYVKRLTGDGLVYFSLLRGFYELRIAKLFARYRKYFHLFSSCNRNFSAGKSHQGLWCGQCAKCVFSFIVLSAFLDRKTLVGIFKKNLYQDRSLAPLFADVLGLGAMKPFDCVGTFEEAQTALKMARKKFRGDFIMRQFSGKCGMSPDTLKPQRETLVPEKFRFLGMERALILGYGKEGKSTERYLKKEYPSLRIGVADAGDGRHYLARQQDYDIAIKTPGMKKELVAIPYTTATNMFFSRVKGRYPLIGITGSKGKSTTASLISAMLKAGGKKAELLGNIGTPMLERLLRPVAKGTVFVLELSSYQLDDLRFSPDIAVVTNLFPEHMDFHGGLQNYFLAKRSIISRQTPGESFIFDPSNEEMKRWREDYAGAAIPFAGKIPLADKEIPLLGEHNKNNIRAAIAAVKVLGVSDAAIRKALRGFKGLPHRLEPVGTFQGITFYDDAISTTPESTIMAITALKNVDTIFLGGQDRGYAFGPLEKAVKKYTIRNVVLFPDSGGKMLRSTRGLTVLRTRSMRQAVAFAYRHTRKGSSCLLSCASPSYSLWKNFEEKGNQFKKAVTELATR